MEVGWWWSHWHEVLETVGIVGGLLFTGVTLRRDLQARKIAEYLTQASQHRRLWSQLHRRPSLRRVLEPDRDLTLEPLQVEERRFLELVFTHFHTGWLIVRSGHSLVPMGVLAADAGHLFGLPAPAAVWNEVRGIHQAAFVAFVERAVATAKPRPAAPAATTG
jgi:nitrate reductase gamma subunit